MSNEISPHPEQLQFKKGALVIYNFPRMKRGIKVPPEFVTIRGSKVTKHGKLEVTFKSGVTRKVKIENLERVY